MPRTKKPRNCACAFRGKAYKPTGIPMGELERVELYLDELEALVLCDRDGLTQEEAGQKMGISRGTVQRILSSARAKVADALSGCKAIVMDRDICEK
ncbi:MAG: DUF134 domain-containing protein [Thermodesulfovibrionales bacterium]|nr:DUF134 domain-containing protein [Thermodesulfovibrionales bacterium]